MDIQGNLQNIIETIPKHVKLVAVSKTMPNEAIEEAYAAGQTIFGENKAQELSSKHPLLPADIEWHFIGHLQTNKVKYIAPFVSMIHAVDSLKLLAEINKQASKFNRIIDCLLQFHIAEEDTKFGLNMVEAHEILNAESLQKMANVRICGLMGMATFTEDMAQVRREFKQLKQYFEELKTSFFSKNEHFKELSMGMSGDYLIAIEEGATIVRIGSTIFGERNYH
jgi:hypothetical protein